MYDVIVIGAGPAGLTAALYAGRQNKKVLVLEKNSFGGQTVYSPKIENYPGIPAMSGMDFADKLVEQVLEQGVELEPGEAITVENGEEGKTVVTEEARYQGKTVIFACGAKHRRLGLPREEELTGAGISYCAVCDGAFFKGKEVAVIGGGNSALQEAVYLAEICKKVHIIQNLETLTGEEKLVEILKKKENVDVTFNSVVKELRGEEELTGIVLENTKEGRVEEKKVEGMFVAIGLSPDNGAAEGILKLDEQGYIPADESCVTPVPGVFVAGDGRTKKVRQIATAIADGATAAIAACRYLGN